MLVVLQCHVERSLDILVIGSILNGQRAPLAPSTRNNSPAKQAVADV